MTCGHCGTEAEPGDGFCRGCGRGLASLTSQRAVEAAPEPKPAHAPLPSGVAAAPGIAAARWGEAGTRPFLYRGNWYSRSGQVVYEYDAGAQQWMAREASSVPYFMRRPAFASLRTPSLVLFGLFGLFVLFSVLAVVADGYQFTQFQRSVDGQRVSAEKLQGARDFWDLARGLQSVVVLAIAPVFIWWVRRATCNVRALGAANPKFSPGWAVGWWFVPIANWFQPLRVLNQAWRASDPSLPAEEGDGWQKARLSPLVPLWWICWQVMNPTWSLPFTMLDEEDITHSEVANVSVFALFTDVAMIGLAGLAVALVAALTRRQDRADARFDAAAAQEAG